MAVLLGVGLAGVAARSLLRDEPIGAQWRAGGIGAPSGAATPGPTASVAPAPKVITMSATGDIVLGDLPGRLPPNGGVGFFNSVKQALKADLVMGNLEEPLTEATDYSKCGGDTTSCHQFRAPPSYAEHLRAGGFDLLNQANNHGHDHGPVGFQNTRQSLEAHGLKHTGAVGQITVVEVEGVKVAVVGFAPYATSNNLVDIASATKLIKKAAKLADLVVVQAHMGAEGAEMHRVKPGTEQFFDENRGDPIKFAHAMIDAGADLIVGHGPHVLRAMEFYRGRLIAYSLGNFAGGGGTLNNSGRLGWGGVLRVSMTADGTWVGGEFISTYMDGSGLPRLDKKRRGLQLVQEVGEADFPTTRAQLDAAGKISASPAA